MSSVPVSVVFITLNEESHLPGALENVRDWADEVFIVDSCSTDRTVDVALEYGAHIVQRPFTNFGDQWNFALERLPVRTPWTLKLDPDERLSPELKDEIATLISAEPPHAGYTMDRRLWFMGKPLHVLIPMLRLWRTGKCSFSKVIVNEHPLVAGSVGNLKGILEHFDSPDLHHWFEKQNRYTTMEAIMRARGDALPVRPRLFGSPLERRMFLKKSFYRLPFRYAVLFLYHFFGCGAWRDGPEGWAWARLRTEIYRAIDLKTREILRTGRVPELPRAPRGDYDPRVLATPLQQAVMRGEES